MNRDWFGRLGARAVAVAGAGLVALALVVFGLANLKSHAESTAPSGEKFRVVTTFTVIQDIAQNVAGDKADRRIDHQARRRDPRLPADARATSSRRRRPTSCCGTASIWSAGSRNSSRTCKDVPSVVVTEGIEPMGISEGPYSGKPNPHAWMSPANALIYVENIRKALAEHDPANADDL